jgi:hypothetical protein
MLTGRCVSSCGSSISMARPIEATRPTSSSARAALLRKTFATNWKVLLKNTDAPCRGASAQKDLPRRAGESALDDKRRRVGTSTFSVASLPGSGPLSSRWLNSETSWGPQMEISSALKRPYDKRRDSSEVAPKGQGYSAFPSAKGSSFADREPAIANQTAASLVAKVFQASC